MNKHVEPYYRWIKREAKAYVLNHQVDQISNRVTSADYDACRKKYEAFTDQLIQEIEALQKEARPRLILPAAPVKIAEGEPVSMVGDSMGRVFLHDGEILRGIYPDSVSMFQTIYESGVLQVLAKYHLIPSVSLTDYATEEFALVLSVEKVTIQKYTVWTYAMIKDACILIAILKTVLNHFDLSLADGHLNNVTFHKGNPMFVDIGSIIPMTDNGFMTELLFAGVYRLVFGFIGNSMMYRLPTHDDDNENIFIFPRSYNLLAREYQNALKVFKRYTFFHGTLLQKRIVHRMFDLHDYDAWDIDLLFPVRKQESDQPVTEFKDIADLLLLPEVSSITVTGGTYGLLEHQLLEKNPSLRVISSDFIEHRLDLAYLNLKELHGNSAVYLYNYLYLQKKQAEEIASDLVFAFDPLSDSAAFWPVKDKVIANAIARLGKQYIALCIPKEKEEEYQPFFTQAINLYAEEISREVREGMVLILFRKH